MLAENEYLIDGYTKRDKEDFKLNLESDEYDSSRTCYFTPVIFRRVSPRPRVTSYLRCFGG
jgi:hypothetical protein